MIIRGGINIYPKEIIYEIPNVKEMEIVSISDTKYGCSPEEAEQAGY